MKPFYITTPIYYVNAKPHIGSAYTSLACDVLARFMRLSGRETYFLTGTDEHGQKVEKSAKDAGKDPQTYTDEIAELFKQLAEEMHYSNDDFIRTTSERHKKGAQAFWKLLEDKGYIYKDSYAGWYSVRDEAYYQESELVDGKAPTGAEVEWVEEPSYFFKLSAFQDKLLDLYESQPEFILPESRKNEVIQFVRGGLKDLSISRTTFDWGVPVPGDEDHVMYVWLDALTNYLTALGYPEETEKYQKFWEKSFALHIVGKDILRFHAVYWPAFLMAAEIPLPSRIVAHGWWTNEGQKISKSLGNVIDPHELIAEFGLDQTRYFLMREVPFGNDGNFSRERMITVINSELANNIGNLTQRTLTMIQKNCDGKVPQKLTADKLDEELLHLAQVTEQMTPASMMEQMEHCKFNAVIADIIGLASRANEYIDVKKPWEQKKNDPEAMAGTLYVLAETIRCIAIMLQPFMPDAAGKILSFLGYKEGLPVPFDELKPEYALTPGDVLKAPEVVFPRVENRNWKLEVSF